MNGIECRCRKNYYGIACENEYCPNNCNNRGQCRYGFCFCESGFSGKDCSLMTCPNECSGNGMCLKGKCICDPNYTGEECSKQTCPNNCNGHGVRRILIKYNNNNNNNNNINRNATMRINANVISHSWVMTVRIRTVRMTVLTMVFACKESVNAFKDI